MSLFYSYKNTTIRIGPKPMIDYYDYLYKSNTYLKIYLTFDTAVSSTGGTYNSGVIYIPNLAPGANNTSDTTGSLFKGLDVAPNVQLSNTTYKWGTNSLYSNFQLLRNNPTVGYYFPQNTGLTFTIWANIVSHQGYVGPLFSFADSGNNTVSLKLNSATISSNSPWYLCYQVDDEVGASNIVLGNYVDPTKTNNPISPNVWNHFAWIISPADFGVQTTYTFYINNVKVATINNSTTIYPKNLQRVYNDISSQPGYSGLNGYFDTFRFYETALTDSDINAMYNYADPKNIM
uniref:Uncharacterized protein n=1 Tax=viral metagenome TaxID=1070528 RepID=A0A6C0HUE3_9ZZZZ